MTSTTLTPVEMPGLCHHTGDGLPIPFSVAGTGLHLPQP